MKTFILRTFYFSILYVFCFIILFFLSPTQKNDFHDSYKSKISNLENVDVIITGGSNVLFGLKSKKISDQTNKKVKNLGIAGGYGIKHILNILPEKLLDRKVLIIPEYENFFSDNFNGYSPSISWNIYYYPQHMLSMDYFQLKKFFIISHRFILDNIKSVFRKPKKYNIKNIDNYGDYNLTKDEKKFFNNKQIKGQINPTSVTYIKKILDSNKNYFLVYPPISEGYYHLNKKKLFLIENLFREEKKLIEKEIKKSVFPDSLFYDSSYHLNNIGKEKNSNRIIKLLGKIN